MIVLCNSAQRGSEASVLMELYQSLIASHATAREAGYSRIQVQNIVNAVVSKQELPDAHVEIARARLEAAGPS
jgi:hypothetical protein